MLKLTMPRDKLRWLYLYSLQNGIDPYRWPDATYASLHDLFSTYVPEDIRKALSGCSEKGAPDIVRVRHMPIDGTLVATPLDGERPVGKVNTSELSLFALADFMGMRVFAYEGERGGALVHQVTPVPGKEDEISSHGASSFGFHTEAPHLEHCPDYLILLCLRGDPDANTAVVRLDDALEDVPEWAQGILRQPIFRFVPGASHKGAPSRVQSVLYDHPIYGQCIRYHEHNIVANRPEARNALMNLGLALKARAQFTNFQPGDAVILNNRRTLHGRTSFEPVFDGNHRWLQRVYCTRDFSAGPKVKGRPYVWES